jgi:hypothetical protein
MTITQNILEELIISSYSNYVVFLIDDSSGTLTAQSTMTDASALEITEENGYQRESLTLGSWVFEDNVLSSEVPETTWNISGGSITATHFCFAVQANTINGDSTGILERFIAIDDGNQVTYNDGDTVKQNSFVIELSGSIE